MNAEESRKAFEHWITAPPIFGEVSQWPGNDHCPGEYQDYRTQLAWEAWQEATALQNTPK